MIDLNDLIPAKGCLDIFNDTLLRGKNFWEVPPTLAFWLTCELAFLASVLANEGTN